MTGSCQANAGACDSCIDKIGFRRPTLSSHLAAHTSALDASGTSGSLGADAAASGADASGAGAVASEADALQGAEGAEAPIGPRPGGTGVEGSFCLGTFALGPSGDKNLSEAVSVGLSAAHGGWTGGVLTGGLLLAAGGSVGGGGGGSACSTEALTVVAGARDNPSIAATNSVIIDPSGKCTLWAKPGPPPKACSSTVMTAATSGTGTDGTACKRKPMSKTTHAIIMKLQIQAQAKQRIQFSSHLWWARLMMQTSSFGKSNVQHWRQMFKPWFMTDHHEASNNIVRYILRFKKTTCLISQEAIVPQIV